MKNMNRYFQKSLLNHPSIVHGGKTLSIVWASAHLRPRGSMMVQGSRIMRAQGILWSTPPVHISGERHWKARPLVWKLIFLLSGGSEVVWWLLLLRRPHPWGLTPECWRSATVTAIPKGSPSPDRENYRPTSITLILSNVYDKLVSHNLSSARNMV